MSPANPPIKRYYEGARPQDFTPEEAHSVAVELQARHRDELMNRNHRFHESRSNDIKELFERAYPGTIGPSGEVVTSAPASDRGSLFS